MPTQRILIADDEAPVRTVLRRFFESEGFEVCEATDGINALETFRKRRFHVVLTDLKMPGSDGLEVVKQIKQIRPQTVVLVLTGYPSSDTTLKALELGSDGYVSKPVDLSRLKSLVVRTLMLHKWEGKDQRARR